MGQFYFADIENCGMIFAKSMYPKRRDCVNVVHNMGDTSITVDDVESRHAVVTYFGTEPIDIVLSAKKENTIPVWVIYS